MLPTVHAHANAPVPFAVILSESIPSYSFHPNKKNAAPFDAAFLIRMKYYFMTFEFVVTFASETHCVTAAS